MGLNGEDGSGRITMRASYRSPSLKQRKVFFGDKWPLSPALVSIRGAHEWPAPLPLHSLRQVDKIALVPRWTGFPSSWNHTLRLPAKQLQIHQAPTRHRTRPNAPETSHHTPIEPLHGQSFPTQRRKQGRVLYPLLRKQKSKSPRDPHPCTNNRPTPN